MGSHTEPRLIVARAMDLRLTFPNRTATSILDEVMPLRDGFTDLEWESTDPDERDCVHPAYDDECLPPSPFAEMLRQAFAPDLDPREMLLVGHRDVDDYALMQRVTDAANTWEQRVMMPFYARYGIPRSWSSSVNIVDRPADYIEPRLSRERWVTRFAAHQMTWGKVDVVGARSLAEQQYQRHTDDDPGTVSLSFLDSTHRAIYDSYHVPGRVDYWSWITRFCDQYASIVGITPAAASSAATNAWASHYALLPEDAAAAVAAP